MNILYIITILAIYILFIIMQRSEKKQNLIAWLTISAILIICYNILICLIYTFIGILCTLANLSVCNAITAVFFSIIIFNDKKIQKYYVKIPDVVFSVLLLIIVIVVAYKQYENPFNIKYKTTDGSSHYFLAEQFYEKTTLLYKDEIADFMDISNLGFKLPGAYVNEGILFKIFDGQVEKIDLFIIFDLAVLYMSGILVYHLLILHAKEKKMLKILAMIFSIMYMLGYQLNSMLYGYVYLSLALNIIVTLLLVMKNSKTEQINNTITTTILAILSFGIFFSYAYFIPIIYIAIFINIIIESKIKKEKILSEDNLMRLIPVMIVPLILGATYFIILPLVKGAKTEVSSITVDGAIYKNYITNLLVYIPIFIVEIILFIKSKKKQPDFSSILFILSIIFVLILFIGNKLGNVSEYYYFKSYYIVWPLSIINVYRAICNIVKNEQKTLKIATYMYSMSYIIIILIATILMKNIGINNIFYTNADIVVNSEEILNNGELKILEKVKKQIEDNQIYILNSKNIARKKWVTALHQNEQIYLQQLFDRDITIEEWIEEKEKTYYLAYYEEYKEIVAKDNYLTKNNDKYEIMYKDKYGFILKRK